MACRNVYSNDVGINHLPSWASLLAANSSMAYVAMVQCPKIWSCDLDLDQVLAAVEVHAHAKFHQDICSISWFIILTEEKLGDDDENNTILTATESNPITQQFGRQWAICSKLNRALRSAKEWQTSVWNNNKSQTARPNATRSLNKTNNLQIQLELSYHSSW